VNLDELDKLANKTFGLPSHYSATRNIAQAWEFMEQMKAYEPELCWTDDVRPGWICRFAKASPESAWCDSASEAITRAALKAKGIEI
jgi:hypothetical protein